MWSIILFSLLLCIPLLLWPGPKCCCGCEECSSAVDYWEVQFGSVVDQVETDCNEQWNGLAFRLCLVDGEDCVWKCETAAGEIVKLTVYLDAGNYKIKVEASLSNNIDATDHVWEKNYGATKPDCAALVSEALTWTTDTNTNCASGTSTCAITAKSGTCHAWCGECDNCGGAFGSTTCSDGTITAQYQVDIAGLVDSGCNCDIWDGSYTATLGSGGASLCAVNVACAGTINDSPPNCEPEINVCIFNTHIQAVFLIISGAGPVTYTVRWNKTVDCSTDCSSFSGTAMTLISELTNLGTPCTVAAPTCLLTSL